MAKKKTVKTKKSKVDKYIEEHEKKGLHPSAHPGNKHAQKLKTPELKKAAFDQYCEHLAKGKSKRSWCFVHPDLTLTWETMEKYIANDPEFDPQKKKVAQIQGFYLWENIVEESAKGKQKDSNVPCLQMVMRNKFGWDKDTNQQKETSEPLVKRLAQKWRGKID